MFIILPCNEYGGVDKLDDKIFSFLFGQIWSICSNEFEFVQMKLDFFGQITYFFGQISYMFGRTNPKLCKPKTYLFVRIRICSDELSTRLKLKLSDNVCYFFVYHYYKIVPI